MASIMLILAVLMVCVGSVLVFNTRKGKRYGKTILVIAVSLMIASLFVA